MLIFIRTFPVYKNADIRERQIHVCKMDEERTKECTEAVAHVRLIEESSAYWRAVFDYPPFNIVDASMFERLQGLLAKMDDSPSLRMRVHLSERDSPVIK
jgi:hypothetical protein